MDSGAKRQLAKNDITCGICKKSIDTIELFQCVRCNGKIFYCEKCGDFAHQAQEQNYKYSGPNIKRVEQIDETHLQLKQKEGKSSLHFLITQYRLEENSTLKQLLVVVTELLALIKSGEEAAKATAVNFCDLADVLIHAAKNLSMNTTHMSSILSNIGSALTPVVPSAKIVVCVVTGLELCHITYKFFQGDIQDWCSYGRLVTRSVAAGVVYFAGNCISYSTGAVIGG